ncbi:TPA: hypothetical protein JBF89_13355 [Legionella pneumophila]|nr:hypothetical protein [Legionella pneumophila]HAU0349952.1 hypothetical protein [Legionella pneumophila]HAU0353443.1 hypothetical protein [Legionella pneumophila]HAU0359532.1 hypothetical protein [Legionella pneumophila]HAU0368089.1 hypothetical protein [Legionella pneumophila]
MPYIYAILQKHFNLRKILFNNAIELDHILVKTILMGFVFFIYAVGLEEVKNKLYLEEMSPEGIKTFYILTASLFLNMIFIIHIGFSKRRVFPLLDLFRKNLLRQGDIVKIKDDAEDFICKGKLLALEDADIIELKKAGMIDKTPAFSSKKYAEMIAVTARFHKQPGSHLSQKMGSD